MDKPRQQDPLYNVKNSERQASTQEQKPATNFKGPFSKGPESDDKNSPLTAAKHDDKSATQKPQQVQPQQQKTHQQNPAQAAPVNDANKGK